jgi:hypothetical protein
MIQRFCLYSTNIDEETEDKDKTKALTYIIVNPRFQISAVLITII